VRQPRDVSWLSIIV